MIVDSPKIVKCNFNDATDNVGGYIDLFCFMDRNVIKALQLLVTIR